MYVSEDYPDADVQRYKNGADAVQALAQGKVDAVVIDNEPAKVFVAENEGLVILESAYAVEEYAIAIAKDNDELLEKVNKALGELKEDGSLQMNYQESAGALRTPLRFFLYYGRPAHGCMVRYVQRQIL